MPSQFVREYPKQLRSFVPAFTRYTDAAFPSDSAVDESTRFALRYEVGRLFGAVERLRAAAERNDLKEATASFSAVSLAYDRYLKAGNLVDAPSDTTLASGGGASGAPAAVDRNEIPTPQFPKYANEKPVLKDQVVVIAGAYLGSTGTLIGTENYSSTAKYVVKLDQVGRLGYREIVVVPEVSVGKRVGEVPEDAALAAPRDMTVQVTRQLKEPEEGVL